MRVLSYKKINIGVAVFFTFLCSVYFANANTVVRSGELVSLPEDHSVSGDYYGAGGTINLSGEITEDLVLIGGKITLNGIVGDNAFIIGGTVDAHGEVGDDLRIVAGETQISELVSGDVLVIGGSVTVLSTAEIGGDLLIYAGEAVVEGKVNGDILGNIGNLRIDSEVTGNVDVTVDSLTLGARTNVAGSVKYVSSQLLTQAQEATISNGVVRNDPVIPSNQEHTTSYLFPVLALLFSALVWYMVRKDALNAILENLHERKIKHPLYGFAFLILTPIVCAVLFASMIGIIVGFTLTLVYFLVITLSVIALIPVIGKVLMLVLSKSNDRPSPLSLFVGALGLMFLFLLPVIGQVVIIAAIIFITGAVVDTIMTKVNFKRD